MAARVAKVLTRNQAVSYFPEQRRYQQQNEKRNCQRDGTSPALVVLLFLQHSLGTQYNSTGTMGDSPVAVRIPAGQSGKQLGADAWSTVRTLARDLTRVLAWNIPCCCLRSSVSGL